MTGPGRPKQHRQQTSAEQEALLYFLHCSLSYQNETLAEIKTLLEQLVLRPEQPGREQKNSG